MKSLTEMDLEDWELLPDDDGYLEIKDDGGKQVYSRTYPNSSLSPSSPTLFQMNYFICPPKSVEITNNQDQAPIQITSFSAAVDPDPVSQVFFKKLKEPEFVDMKLDSPKSPGSSLGIIPQLDFQFDENREEKEGNNLEMVMKSEKMKLNDEDADEGGLNIWKWSLSGIGAICSFGVVAATFCIFSFNKHHHHNHKLQFQIYTDDKRMKQVVHDASKLNEAMRRAHITFGGYYEASL
ncbi:hypothetical protein CASFOL_030942 [Castilleja foliolosa]|uniref:DUF6821 domain-containing protein n=1 Tax=Castilleja foliolosa TaxID=1961234 RepID=A0ABD3C7J3_9LAMI